MSNHKNLLNTEFTWDRYNLSQGVSVSSIARLIDKLSQYQPPSLFSDGGTTFGPKF